MFVFVFIYVLFQSDATCSHNLKKFKKIKRASRSLLRQVYNILIILHGSRTRMPTMGF